MARRKDDRTFELFAVPQPAQAIPGQCNYGHLVSGLIGEVLKSTGLERHDIASRMSRLSGDDVSKNMLDAWSSTARVDHNLPLYRVPLLEYVCETHVLTDWLVGMRGGSASYGKDALLAELGRVVRNREELTRQERELKKLVGALT